MAAPENFNLYPDEDIEDVYLGEGKKYAEEDEDEDKENCSFITILEADKDTIVEVTCSFELLKKKTDLNDEQIEKVRHKRVKIIDPLLESGRYRLSCCLENDEDEIFTLPYNVLLEIEGVFPDKKMGANFEPIVEGEYYWIIKDQQVCEFEWAKADLDFPTHWARVLGVRVKVDENDEEECTAQCTVGYGDMDIPWSCLISTEPGGEGEDYGKEGGYGGEDMYSAGDVPPGLDLSIGGYAGEDDHLMFVT